MNIHIHHFANPDRSIHVVYLCKSNKAWLWVTRLNPSNMCLYILVQASYITYSFENLPQGNHYHVCLHDGILMQNWCGINARHLLRQFTIRNVTSIIRFWTFGIPHFCNSSRPLRWFHKVVFSLLTCLLTVGNDFPTLLLDR